MGNVQINLWHTVGVERAKRDVVKFPKLPEARTTELRLALSNARDGSGRGVLFEIPRRFSTSQRAVARTLVGVGVVVAMIAAVAAFVAPSQTGLFVGGLLVPAIVITGAVTALGFGLDVGVKLYEDGTLRREGWGGITEFDVRRYARVTVADDAP